MEDMLAKQYKDLSRKQIGNVPTIDTSSIKPISAEIGVKSLESFKNTIATFNKFYVENKTKKLKELALSDSGKAEIKHVDGVPQLDTYSTGGTIYQEAYTQAQKVNYQNALKGSIDNKLNESLKEWGDLGDKNDIVGLQTILKTKFDPVIETVSPEFKNYTSSLINQESTSVLRQYTKERNTRLHNGALKSLADETVNLTNAIELNNIQPGTAEATDIVDKIKNNLIARTKIGDVNVNDSSNNILFSNIDTAFQINKLKKDVLELDADGGTKVKVHQISKLLDIINGGNGTVTIGDTEYNADSFKLTQAQKEKYVVSFKNIRSERNTTATANSPKIINHIEQIVRPKIPELYNLINTGRITDAKEAINNLKLSITFPEEISDNEPSRTVFNTQLKSSLAEVERDLINKESALLTERHNQEVESASNIFSNSIFNTNTPLQDIFKFKEIVGEDSVQINLLEKFVKDKPVTFKEVQSAMQTIEENLVHNSDQRIDILLNMLNGQGDSTEFEIFGISKEFFNENIMPLKDFVINRIEGKKKELISNNINANDTLVANILNGGGNEIYTDNEANKALKHVITNIGINDKNKANQVVDMSLKILNNTKATLKPDAEILKQIKKAINNGDTQVVRNLAIPFVNQLMNLGHVAYEGKPNEQIPQSIIVTEILEELSNEDLEIVMSSIANRPDKTTNIFDQNAMSVQAITKHKIKETDKANFDAKKGYERYAQTSDITDVLKKELDNLDIPNYKGNMIGKTANRLYFDILRKAYFKTHIAHMLGQDDVDWQGILKDTANTIVNFNRMNPISTNVRNSNQDYFFSNNVVTNSEQSIVRQYSNFLKDNNVDSKADSVLYHYPMMKEVIKGLNNGTIDVESLNRKNLIEGDFKKINMKFSLGEIITKSSLLLNPLLPLGKIDLKEKDKKYMVEPVIGNKNLNMSKTENLSDAYSYKGINLIPGDNIQFTINQETGKATVTYTDEDGLSQVLIDNRNDNFEAFEVTVPRRNQHLIQNQNKAILIEDIRNKQALSFKDRFLERIMSEGDTIGSFGPAGSFKAREIEPSEKNVVPSLSQRFLTNNEESYLLNTKREMLEFEIVNTKEAYNIIKPDYVVNAPDKVEGDKVTSQYAVIPSQKITYNQENNKYEVMNLTKTEALAEAEMVKSKMPVYNTKEEAERKKNLMYKVTTEDIDDYLGEDNSLPNNNILSLTGKGQQVVDDTIDVLNNALGFGKWEKALLKGIAMTESKNGNDKRTYKVRGSVGIWQLDKGKADVSLFADLQDKYKKALKTGTNKLLVKNVEKLTAGLKKQGYDFNLLNMTYKELQKPINNGAIARLWLTQYKTSEYDSFEKAAGFWKKYFNTEDGKGKVKDFLDKAKGYYDI
nr:hypothetical protein [uncultured Mediterranean phage uvMED]